MKCIILAGGFATRLWPLTENKAKPLLHLKDKPLISHITESLPKAVEIIVSINAVFENEFKKWAQQYPDHQIKIFVEDSADDEFKKGALGATALVIKEMGIQDDLLLLAGDNYFGFPMQKFIDHFKGNPLLAAYDIRDLHQARRFGVVVEKEGQVVAFQEKPQAPKSTLVSTGCFLFPQKNLVDIVDYAQKKNDDLGGVFEYLLEKDERVDVFSFKEKWFDVGSFDGYLAANKDLLGNQVIEEGGVKGEGNQFLGGVYIGHNTMIENSILENSVVLQNCVIKNCVIRNSVIDDHCELQNIDLSHKMIRQGSNIKK